MVLIRRALLVAFVLGAMACVDDVPIGSLDGTVDAGEAATCLAPAMQCAQPSDCCGGQCVENTSLRLLQCQ